MIQRLLIKNYAIIEDLEISFSDNLTVITGETGAGKSILLGALGLIMGNRADTKVFYNAEHKCIIEGIFQVKKYNIQPFFDAYELDYDDEVVVRREITPSGKSRSFVNDTPVNLKVLQKLSSSLIDLHQQFDNLDIHNISFQLRMIDAIADNDDLLAKYQKTYKQYQADKKQLVSLIERNTNSSKESDFLHFQLEEFNTLGLVAGEQASMEGSLNQLRNADGIKSKTAAAYNLLVEDENALIPQLRSIAHSLADVKKAYKKLEGSTERFDSIIIELEDIAEEFNSIGEDTEHDPQRLLEIQERLDFIYKLQNKHHVKTDGELLEVQNKLTEQLNAIGDLSAEIESLEKQIIKSESTLNKLAAKLSKKRKEVAPTFAGNVNKMLQQLSMKHAQVQVEVSPLEELSSSGIDNVEITFSPNKGSKFLPIKDVASGGELSRLTLCTKSLVASAIPLPTLIFDEIDIGVSGDVAIKMGAILRKLSKHHQIVVITHSPQIAVTASLHYFIYKVTKDDRTYTKLKELNEDERIRAIATMLSGSPPPDSAIENAKALLKI